jgi:hypothetical protein
VAVDVCGLKIGNKAGVGIESLGEREQLAGVFFDGLADNFERWGCSSRWFFR